MNDYDIKVTIEVFLTPSKAPETMEQKVFWEQAQKTVDATAANLEKGVEQMLNDLCMGNRFGQ